VLTQLGALIAIVVGLLLVDLIFFARRPDPSFKQAVWWSIGWFVLSLAVAPLILLVEDGPAAIDYTTVYLIERSLSLDNLFVFLLLFAYFKVPQERRPQLLFWGIALALVLRGLAILGGTALIEQFHWVIYALGATLLVLAWRMFQGVEQHDDPESTFAVRLARRIKSDASPLTLALLSMVFADIAFAIDSIPAAFAITTDAFAIWAANAFALLGMSALFVLVAGLVERFRYLSQTISIVLGIVAVKLLIEDWVKIGPVVSLAIVAIAFAVGITASLVQDRRLALRPPPQPSPSSRS
jgi:tellurite resistance protein TerC